MLNTIEASDLGIVNRLIAGNLRVSIWSARKKLTARDLGDADLPPDELASLGSKKICDPASLTIFHTLKGRAVGVLNHYGLEFLGGWAIPEHKAMEVHQKLDTLEREFNDAKEDFLLNYNRNVQDWVDRQNEWSNIIEDSVESVEYVRGRISFQSRFYSVTMPGMSGEGADALCDGFQDEVAGLGRALFDDVAQAATEAWRKSFVGQEKVSHKALAPIRRIHDKLESFSFVDPIVLPITEIIKATLDCLPPKGHIEGLPLIRLQGMVALLRDTEALADLATRKMNGMATNDILAGFIPAEMLQAAETEDDAISAKNCGIPPLATDVQANSENVHVQTVETDQMVVQQSVTAPVRQAPMPSGNSTHPSLFDYTETISAVPASQPTESAVVLSSPAPVEAETVSAPVIVNEYPALPVCAEEPVFQVVPVIIPEESANDDIAVVIPVLPGGMGDFLKGFI